MKRLVFGCLLSAGVGVAALAVLFVTLYRPWQRTWGATVAEVGRGMPGDEIITHSTFDATRAVTIRGGPENIWPWIVQVGYRKAGFYSHDWLDNDRIPSAHWIIPEYQDLRVGDSMPLSRTADGVVKLLEPGRFLLLVVDGDVGGRPIWTWVWGLYPQDGESTRLVTRLHARVDSKLWNLFLEAFEIVMMRQHLLGIKQRVESSSPTPARTEKG